MRENSWKSPRAALYNCGCCRSIYKFFIPELLDQPGIHVSCFNLQPWIKCVGKCQKHKLITGLPLTGTKTIPDFSLTVKQFSLTLQDDYSGQESTKIKMAQIIFKNIGTQDVQELFFLWSLGDRSIHGTVYSKDLVNLTSFFGCNVKQERNWKFMMYIRCYIGNGKIAK